MAQDPVVEPQPDPVVDPAASPPASEGLSEAEITKIVGDAVDVKLAPFSAKLDGIDLEKFKGDILGSVGEMFKAHQSQPVDEASLLGKLEGILDGKLKGIGVNPTGQSQRRIGPLGRYLGIS